MKHDDSEKPEQIIDEIVNELDDLHKKSAEASTNIGFALETVKSVKPLMIRLSNSDTTDPDVVKIYENNIRILEAFHDEVRSGQKSVLPFSTFAMNASGSACSLASASSTTDAMVTISTRYTLFDYPVFKRPDQHEKYMKRLLKFNHSLGDTYQEIWEVLYGTRADPERGALYLIRHAFDNLFNKLAPDNKIRKSLFWKKKDNAKPNQIWREERIQYAAANHVLDESKAKTLAASSKHMLGVYEALNRAHDREKPNQIKARVALEEMRLILEDWADAIGLE